MTVSPPKKHRRVRKKDTSGHYVNNKMLYASLVEYRQAVFAARERGEPTPRIPEEIGRCFLQIATRLSSKMNFSSYTYREDMIADGVEDCLSYIMSFNPERSTNAFSYFTTTVNNAFIRRIKSERSCVYVNLMHYEHQKGDPTRVDKDHQHACAPSRAQQDFDRFSRDFISDFETSRKNKKKTAASQTSANLDAIFADGTTSEVDGNKPTTGSEVPPSDRSTSIPGDRTATRTPSED